MPLHGVRRVLLRSAAATTDTTPPGFNSGEEGDVDNFSVAVLFSEAVVSGTTDYLTGVTIKVNAVPVTVNSAARQANTALVYYVVDSAEEADADDVITWEYSDTLGDIADTAGNQLGDVSATGVTNNVGEHLRFDHEANSMQLLTAGF